MDDDDDHITGFEIQEQSSPPHDEYKYEVLNADEIVENMVSSIRDVNSVVQLKTSITRILLGHFKWDEERLYERLFDDNRESLFEEAKIEGTETLQSAQSTILSTSNHQSHHHKQETCSICFVDASPLIGLGCGHLFCRKCWITYLSTKIIEDGQSSITCAALECNMLVDDQTILTLVTDRQVKLVYQKLITNSYVGCNKQMRWCPKPECGHAVKVVYPEFQPVKCVCGKEFCFLCGENWHEPVRCDMIRKWKKKCEDDSEISHWKGANTKECPKCYTSIEKNGGCNNIVCSNSACRAEFCWLCLRPVEYWGKCDINCNKYTAKHIANKDAQKHSQELLQRYSFYHDRYMNHMASLKFENQLYETIREKMREMQEHNMSWTEAQFLNRAVDVLCQCRQTLMYTYVFAYYQARTNQLMIFENNQRDLESAIEALSAYLERDITSDNIRDIKQKVQDKYKYCASRRRILLEHVQEGYEQDWWVMADF